MWTTPADLCRLAMEIQAAQTGKSASILNQEIVMDMLSLGNRGLGWQMRGRLALARDNVGYKCALLADTLIPNGDAGGPAPASYHGWLKDVVMTLPWAFERHQPWIPKSTQKLLAGCAAPTSSKRPSPEDQQHCWPAQSQRGGATSTGAAAHLGFEIRGGERECDDSFRPRPRRFSPNAGSNSAMRSWDHGSIDTARIPGSS